MLAPKDIPVAGITVSALLLLPSCTCSEPSIRDGREAEADISFPKSNAALPSTEAPLRPHLRAGLDADGDRAIDAGGDACGDAVARTFGEVT